MDVPPTRFRVISGVARVSGSFIGTGFSEHRCAIGPGVGHLIAYLVANDTPLVDPYASSLASCSHGTKIVIDAGRRFGSIRQACANTCAIGDAKHLTPEFDRTRHGCFTSIGEHHRSFDSLAAVPRVAPRTSHGFLSRLPYAPGRRGG